MNENDERIARGLLEAMKTETDGYHFYKMAASTTEDEQGRATFEQLAQEELSHLRALKQQRDALTETGALDPSINLGSRTKMSGPNPIFSPKLKERVGEAHFEMSALSIGIQLELNSEKHYRAQAEQAAAGTARDFFNQLAEWESGHYEALNRQLEELKEDYWSAGGFAPF